MIEEKKNKKIVILIVGIVVMLIVLLGGTYAFFNYTRTGPLNNLGTGRISFNSEQNGTLNLTNIFPMTSSEVDEANLDSVTVVITGDTTYADGEEFEIKIVDVTNTVNGKKIPINYIATYAANNGGTIGTVSNTYWTSRESKNANVYLLNGNGKVRENKRVLVGYIKSGETGVNGTLSIKAYVDADRIAISDTYDGTESDNMGTRREWVNDRTVFTTEEWNSFSSTPISFKIRVESNEGIWIPESENLTNKIKGRLGHDGLVAINSNGDLYDGTGTIREYRYSGIGNYCTYTDGTNNYNISVEGTDCPEHAYRADIGHIVIGSSDSFKTWRLTDEEDLNEVELNRVNTTATDSGLKNYIMFNNEKWRIVGVFGNNVKIMKDLPLTGDLTTNPIDTIGYNGAYANETQMYTNKLNDQFLIKNIAYSTSPKYGYFMYNYYADENYPYNWNDWTHSGLMYYLNETNIGSYYSTIESSFKILIDDTTYYLGNLTLNEDINGWWVIDGTAKQLYEQERGNVKCDESVTEDSQYSNCNIWSENSATWTGKIGLLYPSDYAYASSSDKWSTNEGAYYYNDGSVNNWMFNTDSSSGWMLNPSANFRFLVFGLSDFGAVDFRGIDGDNTVRPVLNLISEAEVIDGDGSFSNPYILNFD